jgi:hypothetical protein
MNNLAEGYESAGKVDLALPLSEETLKLRNAKLGGDHADTLESILPDLRRTFSGPLEGFEVDHPPFVDLVEHRPEALAQRSERILHFGRHLGVNLAMDDPVPLQFSEVSGKHLARHLGHQLPQLAGAFGPWQKVEENIRLPFATQHPECRLYGAVWLRSSTH